MNFPTEFPFLQHVSAIPVKHPDDIKEFFQLSTSLNKALRSVQTMLDATRKPAVNMIFLLNLAFLLNVIATSLETRIFIEPETSK